MLDDWKICSPKRYQEALVNLQKIRSAGDMYTTTQQREKILTFWHTHGLAATRDAFQVSRATLFRWQKEIEPKSRARLTQSRRVVPPLIRAELIRLKTLHPELGKGQLQPLLGRFCTAVRCPVPSEKYGGSLPR